MLAFTLQKKAAGVTCTKLSSTTESYNTRVTNNL